MTTNNIGKSGKKRGAAV